jgi:hypothetical protein
MIRPIDLQATLVVQNAAAVQRAEEGPRIDAQAAQAAFAAEMTRSDESVAAATEVLHNRVGAKPHGGEHEDGGARKHPQTPFEQLVEDVAASSDGEPHIVDFTA